MNDKLYSLCVMYIMFCVMYDGEKKNEEKTVQKSTKSSILLLVVRFLCCDLSDIEESNPL